MSLRLLFFTLFIIPGCVFSQDMVKTEFIFSHNSEYEIRIDKESVYTKNKFELPEGIHFVELWIPGIELITDTIEVYSDSNNVFEYKIRTSQVYRDYSKQLKKYKVNRTVASIVPLTTVASISFSSYFFIRSKMLSNKFYKTKQEYTSLSDPDLFVENNIELESINRSYIKHRSVFYTSLIVSSSLTLCSAVILYYFKKHVHKPIPNFKASPFIKKNLGFSIGMGPELLTLKLRL